MWPRGTSIWPLQTVGTIFLIFFFWKYGRSCPKFWTFWTFFPKFGHILKKHQTLKTLFQLCCISPLSTPIFAQNLKYCISDLSRYHSCDNSYSIKCMWFLWKNMIAHPYNLRSTNITELISLQKNPAIRFYTV